MTLKDAQARFLASCEAVRDLYLFMMKIVVVLAEAEEKRLEAGRRKFNPTPEDLSPNDKFAANRLSALLAADPDFTKLIEKRKLSWDQYDVFIREVSDSIRSKQYFAAYMASPEEVSDVSTRDMSQYLNEMPGSSEEIVKTESGVLYTYERMARDLYFLSVRFPDLLTVNTIGSTKDGRAVYDAVIGNPNGASHFILVYTQHGSEHINTQLAMRQIEYVLTTWTNGGSYADKTFSDIFSNVCFHVIPMANPDGVTIAQLGVEGLRTEAARTVVNLCYELDKEHGKVYGSFEDYEAKFKANANGVDLNKNFNAGWEEMDNNVNYPSTDGYKGTGAVSEPETQAIVSLAETYPISAVIGIHSPGDRIIWNYGAEGDVLSAGKNLAETLKALTKYGMVEESHYTKRVAGGMAEYFVSERNLPALSIMTGGGTLPVSMTYFADIFGRNLNVIPAIAYLYDMPTDDEIAAEEAAAAAEAAAAEAAAEEYEREENGYDVYEQEHNTDDYEDDGGDYYDDYDDGRY